MKVAKELEIAIVNDISDIKSVDVNYSDGDEISGFIKSAKFTPLEVTLCKHQTLKGENPYHFLNFERANKITLIYHNGTTKIFE